MQDPFSFDVFVSHSSNDKATARAIADRLRADGLRVWFDELEIHSGDNIAAKIEQGLERSRSLVLCMSANAFDSEWPKLEAGTFRFRDPLNRERRFIPVRLDEAPIKESLAQLLYVDWRAADRQEEYSKLLEACRPHVVEVEAVQSHSAEKSVQLDYDGSDIHAYAFSPDGRCALTGCDDKTVRLWNMETGDCLHTLRGHTDKVWSITWHAEALFAISGSKDRTLRVWNVKTGDCVRVFERMFTSEAK